MQGETDRQIWHPEVIYSYRMSQALQIKAKLHFLKSFNFLTMKLHNLKLNTTDILNTTIILLVNRFFYAMVMN